KATFCPSVYPRSCSARMSASLDATVDGAGNGERMPIRRSRATCWALTLCGHAAIPPTSPMNSRRRIDHLAGGSQQHISSQSSSHCECCIAMRPCSRGRLRVNGGHPHPAFRDLKSLSAVPQFPALSWMDSHNGGSVPRPDSFSAANNPSKSTPVFEDQINELSQVLAERCGWQEHHAQHWRCCAVSLLVMSRPPIARP